MAGNKYRNARAREALKKIVFAGHPPCYLCGLPIDYSLPKGLIGSPEMDDIIPVSKGGNPLDADNLRAVHKRCNGRRGNVDINVAMRNERSRKNTSRIW